MPVILRWLLRLGPMNPIAQRLVQNGSRRTKHFYLRAAYLAALILVLLWSLLYSTMNAQGSLDYRTLAAAGASAFTWTAYLQVALIALLAPVFMAGAIAQEANPRNWDILLTTPLSAAEIVLGNLFGRLLFILALLLASLPLFAITQYFGGVPGRSIFASYAIASSAAIFVGSVAIALSVSRLVGRRAVFTFYIAVVTYLAITIGMDVWINAQRAQASVTWLTAINPFLCLRALLNPTTYARAPEGSQTGLASWFLESPVTTFCTISLLLSAVLMMASTITVRLGGLLQAGSESSGMPWYRKILGMPAKDAEHRAPRGVWTNPIAWREAAARNATMGRIVARWSFIGLGGLLGLSLIVMFHIGTLDASGFQLALITVVMGELGVIVLVAVNMSATAISREREDGTLDLLLTTPITPSQYLTGKLRGLVAYLLPMLAVPLGTLLLASIYTLVGGLGRDGGVTIVNTVLQNKVELPVVLPEGGFVAPLAVVPFVAFCLMVGLQFSLKSKGTLGSVVATFGAVGIAAGILGLCAWNAASDVPVAGPALAGLSPAAAIFAIVHPADMMLSTYNNSGGATARTALVVGCLLAAPAYAAFIYGIHASMVRNFDVTVRKLAGNK
ncbi:MAG: ABC transporter permease subunit [Planctomycetes bacterium]|nr:ABC transporter permease subunit [Planctomycetota bacterium]